MLAESEQMKLRKTNYSERLQLEKRQIIEEKFALERIPVTDRSTEHNNRIRKIDSRQVEIVRLIEELQNQIQLYNVRIEGQQDYIRQFLRQ